MGGVLLFAYQSVPRECFNHQREQNVHVSRCFPICSRWVTRTKEIAGASTCADIVSAQAFGKSSMLPSASTASARRSKPEGKLMTNSQNAEQRNAYMRVGTDSV